MKAGSDYPTLETVAAVIAHSQIVVAPPHSPMPALPGGFEDLDISVLCWIAVEGRRLGRGSCGLGQAVSRVPLGTVAQARTYVYFGEDFGRDRAHSMSFCRFFYTSWPDVVAAAPNCQTILVRMSIGSSPSAPAPARGSRFAMGILFVWVIEFIKLLGRRRLHPLNAECPICHQMVRLHYNKAGRRHLLAHARSCSLTLYEGARYCVHYTAKIKCLGSGTLAKFDPRPNENQHFKLPKFLELEGWSTSSSERGDVRLRTRTDRQSGHSHSAVP
jgi:hypothetical protein